MLWESPLKKGPYVQRVVASLNAGSSVTVLPVSAEIKITGRVHQLTFQIPVPSTGRSPNGQTRSYQIRHSNLFSRHKFRLNVQLMFRSRQKFRLLDRKRGRWLDCNFTYIN